MTAEGSHCGATANAAIRLGGRNNIDAASSACDEPDRIVYDESRDVDDRSC
jgi:hypothetical protein